MTREENIKFREEIIKIQFKYALEYELNLENPQTFNEKMQWLKLYYHDPIMTISSDKYLAREYIKETVGEEYLVPLIGVWDRVEDIDFDKLPNQFVLKVNWGSGQNIIVKDKTQLDIEEAKNKLRDWMHPTSNHYYYSYEWCYKNIKPKIICEKYIEQSDGNLLDYKIFCFNGKPQYIQVHVNRFTDHSCCTYDTNWNNQHFNPGIEKLYEYDIEKPNNLDIMLKYAALFSSKFIFLRIDFYYINNKTYIGELTIYPGSGLEKFSNYNVDVLLGSILELPKEKKIEYDLVDIDTLLNQVSNLEPIMKQYRDLEYNFNCANINNSNIINTLNSDINIKNNTIDYLSNEIEDLKLNVNWFSLLSIFGIQLFSISNNANYLRLTILGIKLTFKVNEKSINKMAWWIPIKGLRNNFRAKFKIEDQTRPDQTRPDQTRPDQTTNI